MLVNLLLMLSGIFFTSAGGWLLQKTKENEQDNPPFNSNVRSNLGRKFLHIVRCADIDSLTVDLFKIPDVSQRLKRRHTAPAFQTFLLSLWPGQKSAWISILPDRFQPYNLLCEAKDLVYFSGFPSWLAWSSLQIFCLNNKIHFSLANANNSANFKRKLV